MQALLQVPSRVYLTASMVCGLTILAGSLYRILELAEGGEKVAQLLRGRKVGSETADRYERRLLNSVEEMALAAGTPLPAVYVLDYENDINAFAAGWSTHDAAVGVSRGALRLLTRDELQGVLAHEFGHVLNGDMRLNTLMAGVLNGLLVVALAGEWMVDRNRTRYLWSSAAGDSTSRSTTGMVSLGITVLGLALVLLGYLGVFLGQLIQAAVSRQRELLADASAVQFTRNPGGLTGALKKIGRPGYGRPQQSGDAAAASDDLYRQRVRADLGPAAGRAGHCCATGSAGSLGQPEGRSCRATGQLALPAFVSVCGQVGATRAGHADTQAPWGPTASGTDRDRSSFCRGRRQPERA